MATAAAKGFLRTQNSGEPGKPAGVRSKGFPPPRGLPSAGCFSSALHFRFFAFVSDTRSRARLGNPSNAQAGAVPIRCPACELAKHAAAMAQGSSAAIPSLCGIRFGGCRKSSRGASKQAAPGKQRSRSEWHFRNGNLRWGVARGAKTGEASVSGDMNQPFT